MMLFFASFAVVGEWLKKAILMFFMNQPLEITRIHVTPKRRPIGCARAWLVTGDTYRTLSGESTKGQFLH
jgi:hypothetical protein